MARRFVCFTTECEVELRTPDYLFSQHLRAAEAAPKLHASNWRRHRTTCGIGECAADCPFMSRGLLEYPSCSEQEITITSDFNLDVPLPASPIRKKQWLKLPPQAPASP